MLDCYYFVDENSSDTSINYYSDNKYSIVETKHLKRSVCNTTLEKTETIGKYYICLRADGNKIPIVRMGNIVKGE